MWGVVLQMMVCVLKGVEPSIYSSTRTVRGVPGMVGGGTALRIPPQAPPQKAGPGRPHQGCGRTWVRPHPPWGRLPTAFWWWASFWAWTSPVVTDGFSSVFWWAFPFDLDLRLFWIRFHEVRFLVSFVSFHVSFLKVTYITKLVERLDQSPTFYLFYY